MNSTSSHARVNASLNKISESVRRWSDLGPIKIISSMCISVLCYITPFHVEWLLSSWSKYESRLTQSLKSGKAENTSLNGPLCQLVLQKVYS